MQKEIHILCTAYHEFHQHLQTPTAAPTKKLKPTVPSTIHTPLFKTTSSLPLLAADVPDELAAALEPEADPDAEAESSALHMIPELLLLLPTNRSRHSDSVPTVCPPAAVQYSEQPPSYSTMGASPQQPRIASVEFIVSLRADSRATAQAGVSMGIWERPLGTQVGAAEPVGMERVPEVAMVEVGRPMLGDDVEDIVTDRIGGT